MREPIAKRREKIDIGRLGIPYDGALTNRPGARHGPREVRNQSSLMRAISHATRINPYDLCRIADVGDAMAITAGVPFGTPGATNILRIAWVE